MRSRVTILISVVAGALVGSLATVVSVYLWLDQEHLVQFPDRQVAIPEPAQHADSVSPSVTQEHVAVNRNSSLHVQSLLDSTKLASDFDQSLSLYLLLSHADKHDVERYINESFSIPSRNQRVAALSIIFGRYAALDPSDALTKAIELDQLTTQERSSLVQSIFIEWTVADLDAAIAAIEELPQPFKFTAASAVIWRSDDLTLDQRRQLTERVGLNNAWISHALNNIEMDELKNNPRQAYYDHIRESTYTHETNAALLRIARHWIELDGVSVLEEIHDSLDNSQARNFVLTNAIWQAVGNGTADPAAVLEVISGFDDRRTIKQAVDFVFSSWSNSNPKESFLASLEYDDEFVTPESRSGILHVWGEKNPRGLLAEANSLPPRYRETAIVEALGGMSFNSPEEAIRHVRTLDSDQLQLRALDKILQQWATADAKSAFEWLTADGLNANSRASFYAWHRTFSEYLSQDFESARTYAANYQGERSGELNASFARHLIKRDVDQAIAYLPNVSETYRPRLQEQIGTELVRDDPFEALKYASKVEPGRRESYVNSVITAWAQLDSVALYKSLARVPSEYRSPAARILLRVNIGKHLLNDREIKDLEEMVANEDDFIAASE